MLILTRRPGEAILIGENIEILVKEVGRNHVRLGINAPREITIRRVETLDSSDADKGAKEPSEE
jgi:carbon storage regulator